MLTSGSPLSFQFVLADYTGKSTTTTNPKDAKYYNNDLKSNTALSDAAKAYANNPENKAAAQKIIGENGGQCGIQCATAMDAAAKAGSPASSTTTNGKVGTNSVASTNTDTSTNNILGLQNNDLRNGNVDMNTIPYVIVSIISTLLGIAGTVAIFSLIYHAVQMQINSGITGDSSWVDKAKKWMIGALIGFVIAISAWFLVTNAVALLGAVT